MGLYIPLLIKAVEQLIVTILASPLGHSKGGGRNGLAGTLSDVEHIWQYKFIGT